MTQEKLNTGNKLLIDFLKDTNSNIITSKLYKFENGNIVPNLGIGLGNPIKLGGNFYRFSYYYELDLLRFHISWDWLMPIVKKIKDTICLWDFESEEYSKFEEIFDIDHTMSDFMNNNIDGIWTRCVEFVEYYNTLK